MSEKCPNCRQLTNASSSRLVKDTCGHTKCRMCLIYEDQSCKTCQEEHCIRTIGDFDYPIPSKKLFDNASLSNPEFSEKGEENILPLELVINKIPDQFELLGSANKTEPLTGVSILGEATRTDDSIVAIEESNWFKPVDNGARVDDDVNSTKMCIPRIEPLELVSNIRSQLEGTIEQEARIGSVTALKAIESYEHLEAERDEKEKILKKRQRKCLPTSRSHISVVVGNPSKYKCNVCGRIFNNRKDGSYHNACVTGIRPYQCNYCNKSFIKQSHFEYHERMHTGYKPFKCSICEKAFPQRNKLNRHMYTHKGEKRFKCLECDKGYSKKDDLTNHEKVHSGVTPYTCKLCDKSFRVLTNLRRHMHTHSNERPHMCEQCGKSFKDKCLLVRHKRTHGKERPFSCADCIRVFLSKSELKRHLAVHSEVKPFICEFCNTVFRRKDNLNRHVRHHHSEDSVNESNVAEVKALEKVSKPTKPKPAGIAKQRQKPKCRSRSSSMLLPKSPAKVSVVYVNSRDQINSRLDSMGNITPVIRATGEVSNAVPVINGPISIKRPEEKIVSPKKIFTHTEPIPMAEAVVINKRIEEKLYPQAKPFFRDYCSRFDRPPLALQKLPSVRTNVAGKATFSSRIYLPEKRFVEAHTLPQPATFPSESDKAKSICREVDGEHSTVDELEDQLSLREQTDAKRNDSKHMIFKKRAFQVAEIDREIVNRNDPTVRSDKEAMLVTRNATPKPERANCVLTITKAGHIVHHGEASETKVDAAMSGSSVEDTNTPDTTEVNVKKLDNVHWRRRTCEIFKPCQD